jgi:hypothetical protein
MDWNKQLTDQLEFHWKVQARPRLDGMTDEEYFWEPVPGAWTIRKENSIDWQYPPPEPKPVTTIAWRMAHIIVSVFNMRTASHFGGPPADHATWQYAMTADDALKQLDDAYEAWMAGARTADLSKAVGPAEGPFAEEPMATLVLHINREVIHHAAEIALLRDLYLRES